MVKLFCAIVGVAGSAFEVKIDDEESVSALKEAIKAKKANKIKCDPDELHLFLAKAGGNAWLSSLTEDVKKLKNGVKTALVEALTHKDKELQGEDPISEYLEGMDAPKVKQIHVLVVVPEGAVGSASDTSRMDQVVQEVHEIHAQTVRTKRKRYVHSKVGSSQGKKLLHDLSIKVDTVRTVRFPVGMVSLVGGFDWTSVVDENGEEIVLTEEQQRERYRRYVEHNIGAVLEEKGLCVVGVEKGQDILTVDVPDRDIDLVGRTDILVLSDIINDNPTDLQYLPDVKMLIEVKREVKPSCDFQALSELIALDLLVDEPVVALLTDLNGAWLFFWVSEKKNNSARIDKATIKNPGEAFEVIRALLAQQPTADTDAATEIKLPCFQRPVKRLKLKEALPSIGEGGESGGIRESIERYYDIASILGPDLDMARAVARQVTRSIPTLSYFS